MALEFLVNTEIVIDNVLIENIVLNGNQTGYRLTPNSGFVLHNKLRNITELDGSVTRRYGTGPTTVNVNYDFNTTTVIDGYTAYGPNEYFARPRSEVAADQIYGLKPETETI